MHAADNRASPAAPSVRLGPPVDATQTLRNHNRTLVLWVSRLRTQVRRLDLRIQMQRDENMLQRAELHLARVQAHRCAEGWQTTAQQNLLLRQRNDELEGMVGSLERALFDSGARAGHGQQASANAAGSAPLSPRSSRAPRGGR